MTSAGDARVAVVVTCFNDGETLAEAIASIVQDDEEIELVVVDDGSTDDRTRQLLFELERSGTRVVRQANQGQAAAAMAGVAATRAPYVMRFDADDLLEPGAMGALAGALDESPEAAAAWGDVQTFGITKFCIPSPPALDPWLTTYTNCITGSGVLFRRGPLLEAGGWSLREGYEDWDLWMALAERDRVGVRVPCIAFRYRRDDGGRLTGWLGETDRHFEVLRRRHECLFASRSTNRGQSPAPVPLKVLIPVVEALPFVPRLTKIHLCELLTRLLWCGGLRMTLPMVREALILRLRHRYRPLRG